jgi:hypothetical protein
VSRFRVERRRNNYWTRWAARLVAAEWRQGVARRSVALAEASRLSGGSEGPLAVMLIPHDRADLRLECFRR